MKFFRINVYIITIALTVSFSACTKNKDQTSTAQTAEAPKESEATDTKSSSSNSVDIALDEYGKAVDEYKVLMDRLKKGDVKAAQEMQDLSVKLQATSEKIQTSNGTNTLTPAQAERSKKISEKYVAAAQ